MFSKSFLFFFKSRNVVKLKKFVGKNAVLKFQFIFLIPYSQIWFLFSKSTFGEISLTQKEQVKIIFIA